jgi:dTDP-4-dehydrorhamnose 3,5-epimerase
VELSADNAQQLWIPPGFAHGFLVLSMHADVLYKTTEYWMPAHDRCLAWNDPQLNITWPLTATPLLSSKDAQAPQLAQAETFA